MKKVISIIVSLSLILSFSIPSFAVNDNASISEDPIITSTMNLHQIDYEPLYIMLQNINDEEQKELVEKLLFTPVAYKTMSFDTDSELQEYINSSTSISAKTLALAEKLSSMPSKDAEKEVSRIIQSKANELIKDKNAKTTDEFVKLVEQYNPASAQKLESKIGDFKSELYINKDDSPIASSTFIAAATKTIYWNTYLQALDAAGGQMSFFAVSANYTYNTSTYVISSLNTDEDYGIPSSSSGNDEYFDGLAYDNQYVKTVSGSSQAYVQKGAYVWSAMPPGHVPMVAYIVDVVFRPALNSGKNIKFSKCVMTTPSTLTNYNILGKWGGGV
jgi:hypothetical protein